MTTPAYRFTGSSFKGNPEKAARRAEIRAYWLANPHALSRDVAAHFGITKDTARQHRPTAIKHLAIPHKQTTEITEEHREGEDEVSFSYRQSSYLCITSRSSRS